jgi:hypothetical protein
MWLLGQLVRLPLTAFVYGVDMFVKTVQGLQNIGDEGLEAIVGTVGENPKQAPYRDQAQTAREVVSEAEDHDSDFTMKSMVHGTSGTNPGSADSSLKERGMMNKDLHDDMLKLVRYKILFVMREYEHAFPEREDLVSDNMDASALTAWKIAEFIQELGRGETPVPKKWEEKGYPPAKYVRDGKLIGLKEDDKKYLRLYYEVLERYPREKFKYEEQQIRVLEEIRDKLDTGSTGPVGTTT